jgi:uncharacterized phage infection (PIP) family protein YhgE
MTTLEAQLLMVIEEQQTQLKEQQQQQEQSLKLIQAQSRTIGELESYTKTLSDKHSLAVEVVKRYQGIVKQLSEQTIPPHFSETLQRDLQQQLEKRLTALLDGLSVEQQISKALPRLTKIEIEKQLEPMTKQVVEKLDSVEHYQQILRDLVERLSGKL